MFALFLNWLEYYSTLDYSILENLTPDTILQNSPQENSILDNLSMYNPIQENSTLKISSLENSTHENSTIDDSTIEYLVQYLQSPPSHSVSSL